MKRRGFLGLLGGAAVAGPAAAKNVIAQAAPLSSAGSLMESLAVNSYGMPCKPKAMFSSLDRIEKLKRLISGDEEPEFDLYETNSVRRVGIENAVQSLHSVSPVHKIAILRREAERMERERREANWARELKQLLGMEP